MKKSATAILVAAVILSMVSCKKEYIGGPAITETKAVQNFSGIDLRMNGTVYYTSDTAVGVTITAPEKIQSMLETPVIDDHLVIRYKNGETYYSDNDIRINVTAPDISSFTLNASGSIFLLNDITPNSLYLRTTASGNISLKNVVTGYIDAETTVSGKITATGGTVINEKLKTKSSGKIDFSAIAAKDAIVTTKGSGDIKVNASEKLDATIDGSGSVYFSSYPMITTNISGTGKLIHF